MSAERKVLLLIDCQPFWQKNLRVALENYPFDIIVAGNATEACLFFASRPDIDIVIFDDNISGSELDTIELIEEFRRGFGGHMIACCINCNNGDALVRAGCDEYVCKSHLADELLARFGIEPILAQ